MMPTPAETDHILEVLREDVETALTEAAMAQERQALLQLEVSVVDLSSRSQGSYQMIASLDQLLQWKRGVGGVRDNTQEGMCGREGGA